MAKFGVIGEGFEIMQEEVEQGGATAKQQITGKSTGQTQGKSSSGSQGKPFDNAQGKQAQSQTQQPQAADQAGGMPSESAGSNKQQDDSTKQFVADLYGGQASSITQAEIAQKEEEDKAKAEALRKKLHDETYFQPLINPPKQQEERPAEKIEREEKEKKEMELAEEEKRKKDDLPVIVTKDMGTKEGLRGVSG